MSDTETPSMAGKIVLVTGATAGLGLALVWRLTELDATVIAHARDAVKLANTVEEVKRVTGTEIDTVRADLAELAQVYQLADEVLDRHQSLHVLVNNAGVGFGPPRGEREVSADGIELRFAVNHLASYALARRLTDRLIASAPSRIVQVASAGQLALDPDDPFTENTYDGVTAYRRSKLAQIMASHQLAADLVGTGVTVNAVHPATFMDTAMVREHGTEPVSTIDEGLAAVLRLVAEPKFGRSSGNYYHGTRLAQPDQQADDPTARAWLRTVSDDLIARAATRR